MQTALQHRLTQTPSLGLALAGLVLTAVVVMLNLLASNPRVTTSEYDVTAAHPASFQLDASGASARESRFAVATGSTENVQLWRSDIMDSHASVPSLAALGKSVSSAAQSPETPSGAE